MMAAAVDGICNNHHYRKDDESYEQCNHLMINLSTPVQTIANRR